MNNRYTSLEFSKKLKENGCELESEKTWVVSKDKGTRFKLYKNENLDKMKGLILEYYKYQAYDIANDILIRYDREFFGKEFINTDLYSYVGDDEDEKCDRELYLYNRVSERKCTVHTQKILKMLQQDKDKKEIEKYIWDNCLFNPKNKEEE